jgi:exopolyphosphatase/guanosine-5'-triphosphate,3'-diphosphate pyrophosphatase
VTLARAACIDIGSNTTRLLVAEPDPARPGGLLEVAAHRAFVRLTATERRTGIPADKARAIAEAVAEQALTARANGI